MTILRVLYLKRNQLILFVCIVLGAIFLLFDAMYRGKWQCWDKNPKQHYDSRGRYIILYNYVMANQRFSCGSAVTYCSHADLLTLNLVKTIAGSYDGPISIAVYSPGNDFLKVIKVISHLRSCYAEVSKLVTFHIVFDIEHFPTGESSPLFKRYYDDSTCSFMPRDNDSEVIRKNLSYPINLLRNVARDSSVTHFVLSVDLPLIPPVGFSSKFIQMITRLYSGILRNYSPVVFVLPAFAIGEYIPMPENKSDLAKILTKGDGDIYQQLECSRCHTVPEMSYKIWLQRGDFHELGIAFVAKRTFGWQPFFVGTHSDPRFDERYLWKGIKDRKGQMYAMCTTDYNFLVLDNAYLIQRQTDRKETNEVEAYNMYLRSLDRDFTMIFGPNEKCYLSQ